MLFNKICIIGIGLLGASLGLAIKEKKIAGFVSGLARREGACKEAMALGAADIVTCDINTAVNGADLVILATPISMMPDVLLQTLPFLDKNTLVTDVGSVKAPIVSLLEKTAGKKCHFIGSHPMAGSDKSGMSSASSSLFNKAVCIVTPTRKSVSDKVEMLVEFWKALGMSVKIMDSKTHDKIAACVSHAPHLVAACLVNALGRTGAAVDEYLSMAGKGWKDTTRVAASSSVIWGDILADNRKEVLKALKGCKIEIEAALKILKKSDKKEIGAIFDRAKEVKDREPV